MSAPRSAWGTAHLQEVLDNEVDYHLWRFWRSLAYRAEEYKTSEQPVLAEELRRIAAHVQSARMLLKHTSAPALPIMQALRNILTEFTPDDGVDYGELEIAHRAAKLAAHEMTMPD